MSMQPPRGARGGAGRTGAGTPAGGGFLSLQLDYPMSLGTFETYPEAQRAIDALSDAGFPVRNCLIVGTDLKALERVTGRLTWGRVAATGFVSGLWFGLFIGLVFALFGARSDALQLMAFTALVGGLFGMVWMCIGYAFTRGARDFTSISQTVATRYEVLVEHKHAQDAREILVKEGLLPPYGQGYPGPATTPPPGPVAEDLAGRGTAATGGGAPAASPPAVQPVQHPAPGERVEPVRPPETDQRPGA